MHAVINKWLKDPSVYCNECSQPYQPELGRCCENPHIGRNWDFCELLISENKVISHSRLNEFGSNKDKNLRWSLRLPPRLYETLNNYMKQHGHKTGLFDPKKPSDLNKFMKRFPMFAIAKKV